MAAEKACVQRLEKNMNFLNFLQSFSFQVFSAVIR